jgi:Putative prokaryotic signal transducing protein
MGLIKIFSGNEILALALNAKIEAIEVKTVMKNNIQAARISGFGESGQAVEIFINEKDYGKINKVLEDFRMSI